MILQSRTYVHLIACLSLQIGNFDLIALTPPQRAFLRKRRFLLKQNAVGAFFCGRYTQQRIEKWNGWTANKSSKLAQFPKLRQFRNTVWERGNSPPFRGGHQFLSSIRCSVAAKNTTTDWEMERMNGKRSLLGKGVPKLEFGNEEKFPSLLGGD